MKFGRYTLATTLAGTVIAAGLTAGLLVAFPAHAEAPGDLVPVTGAVFNDPTGSEAEQYAIRDHVKGLVDSTQSGETISMSLYNITDDERVFADALIAAADRGVNVRVVLEAQNAGSGSATAIGDRLGSDQSEESWALVCSNGCHGTNINHNKFYLFSDIGGQADVVVQSSANLTISNSRSFWNNAVTFVGNTALYDAYLRYFGDLARDQKDSSYYTTFSAGDIKGYHFPRSGVGDTVANTLGNVACGSSNDPTRIRVGMWYFGRAPVAQELARLGQAGCQIEIVYTEMLPEPKAILESATNVAMKHLPEGGEYIIHSKYYLIDGHYADVDRRVVFTGSPNFSNKALRVNDETMLRIYSDQIHDQYAANFEQIITG